MMELNIQSGCWFTSPRPLSDIEHHLILNLYQPLMSLAAVAFYEGAFQLVKQQDLLSQRSTHAQLLNHFNLESAQFQSIRGELEALRLCRTFQTQDALGPYLIYQLQLPMTPTAFFHDNLLSTLLYERVDEPQFKQLFRRYYHQERVQPHPEQEITTSFFDVYTLDAAFLLNPPEIVQQASQAFGRLKDQDVERTATKTSHFTNQVYDWEGLGRQLQRYRLNLNDIKNYEAELLELVMGYDITISQLARVIGQCYDLGREDLNIKQVAAKIGQDYQPHQGQSLPLTTAKAQQSVLKIPDSKTWQGRFSASEIEVLKQTYQLKPQEFLQETKLKYHSYVGRQERRVVNFMIRRSILPQPVLNMLIEVIVKNYDTVTESLLDRIAQDWLRQRITTPEAAMSYTRDRGEQQFKNTSAQKTTSKKALVEPVPSWSKQPSTTASKVSSTAQNEMAAKLKHLQALRTLQQDSQAGD